MMTVPTPRNAFIGPRFLGGRGMRLLTGVFSSPKTVAAVSGNLLFGVLLLWLLILQVGAILRSPYFGPASLVEESAYTYYEVARRLDEDSAACCGSQ